MLRYAIIFLIIALIAEAFGAGGVAGEASWIAHVLLVISVIFIIISFVTGRSARLPFDPTNSVLVSEESRSGAILRPVGL